MSNFPLISTWTTNGDTNNVPINYVFPPHRRPGRVAVPPQLPGYPTHREIEMVDAQPISIPEIKLKEEEAQNRPNLIRKLVEAAQEYGIFEVTDHGIEETLIDETRHVIKEFFELPPEDKFPYCSNDLSKKFIVYTSSIEYHKEALHYWRDAARHSCTPLRECVRHWPKKPLLYRDMVSRYVEQVREMGAKILDLLGEGLGLGPGYFKKERLFEDPNFTVNHYPACPDPSVTWGSAEHYDPGLMTVLLQDHVPGLQFLYHGQWIDVVPKKHTFVLNVGNLLEIISNGRLKSVKHRVITNSSTDRTTGAFFMEPRKSLLVQPAQALVSRERPPLYMSIRFGEMLSGIRAAFSGEMDCAMEAFMHSLKIKYS